MQVAVKRPLLPSGGPWLPVWPVRVRGDCKIVLTGVRTLSVSFLAESDRRPRVSQTMSAGRPGGPVRVAQILSNTARRDAAI